MLQYTESNANIVPTALSSCKTEGKKNEQYKDQKRMNARDIRIWISSYAKHLAALIRFSEIIMD